MSRETLTDITRQVIDHGKAGTMAQADDVMKLPAEMYYSEERFELELECIWRRIPLLVAAGSELPEPGDFKTMDIAGASLLITRTKDGQARAFMNACTHRGAVIEREACGHKSRFTCPYHGWTFSNDGRLVGVSAPQDFGDIDKQDYGLVALPTSERAGLIWVILNPESTLDFDNFLAGYDDMLGQFGFENWKYISVRSFKGPNWKIAFDGYLEYYHIPVLHGQTFGTDSTNRGLYYAWGPHQHIKSPAADKGHIATEVLGYMADLFEKPEADWDLETMTYGVWTVFPCASIACFGGGGRGVMFSQILPGAHVGESITNQIYLMAEPPKTEKLAAEAEAQFDFFQEVVMREDYATGYTIQKALPHSGLDHILLGRNELGNQRFHQWCNKVVEAETEDDLKRLFAQAERAVGLHKEAAE